VITVPKDSELLLPPDEEDGVDVESDKKKRKFFNLETVENKPKLQDDEEEEEEEDEDEENEDEDEDEEENEDDEDQGDEESASASRMDTKDNKDKTDNKKPNKKPNKKTGKKTGKTDKKGKKKGKKKGSKKSSNDDGDCIITYEHCNASFRTPVFTRAAKQLGLENWTFSSLETKVSR
jgi:hypothetical protein